jgi:hypothetical protein
MTRKQSPKIETRLTATDHKRFLQLAEEKKVSMAELSREAILAYLDNHQTETEDRRETKVERRLKAIEDRYASLLVRIGIDTGTIMALLSSRIESSKRTEVMDSCYRISVRHFNKKLEGVAKEMKQSLSKTPIA